MFLHQWRDLLSDSLILYCVEKLHVTDSALPSSLTSIVGRFVPQQAPSCRQYEVVEGQCQALIQTFTLQQGNLTLIQQQRPVEAVSPARCAHLCGGRLQR